MAANKKARTNPPYELLYWPGIPGRGEFIRLAFEAAGVSYKDTANESKDGVKQVISLIDPSSTGTDGNPPPFAPPALRIPGEGPDGSPLLIYQTPSILSYLGPNLDLAGSNAAEQQWILSHTLTALDLNNETHDTHHPISVGKYYEDQKEESLKKAQDFREARIPKFLGFFERVLKGNTEGEGRYLVGKKLSYADTTLWHVLSGLEFAFPKEMEARKGEFELLFGKFYHSVKEASGVKEYLASDRRQPFSMGVFRHYPELDRQ
ncbi:glutathione s-transferase [Stagonosporopsis vannaccii]|nr:glutathione s-transferase [Stagonosporopsis vannaccii]